MAPSASVPPMTRPADAVTSIFHLTHDLHRTVTRSIDTALSWDQLNSPPVNYTLVRPIVERFTPNKWVSDVRGSRLSAGPGSLGPENDGASGAEQGRAGKGKREEVGDVQLGAVLYALMANRIQFINLAEGDLSYAPLQNARAAFCELLAMKILRTYPRPENEAELAEELIHEWCAFDGAPEDVWESMGEERDEVQETTGSALELAIVSTSKHFLSLPLIQHLIAQIYSGQLIYLPTSSRSLISDSYISERTQKRRQASHSSFSGPRPNDTTAPRLGSDSGKKPSNTPGHTNHGGEVFSYDPYEAGWLDHQRLRVPKWRNWLECLSFAMLIGLFIATLTTRDISRVHPIEIIFTVFTFGFILDEFAASKEHGWSVYSANAWNAFDLVYIAIFLLFFSLRVFGLSTRSPATSDLAFDILACAACVLFPRLVFYLIKDQVVIIALRAMIARFLGFMGLTILAFSGICFCLWTLGRATWTVKQIIWLMLQIWFGSSYLGFSASESFHPIFGPIILISYAALCNVLLITILIAILSNKFAEINGNAQEEHMFQSVLKTVEGVRSDAIFSYLPPVNLLAFFLLMPLSWVCSPRTLHRINVFAVRLTNFPILFAISAYERWVYRARQKAIRISTSVGGESLPRPKLLDSWLAGGSEVLIASVFEAGPPPSLATHSPNATNTTASTLTSDSERDSGNESTLNRDTARQGDHGKRERGAKLHSPLAKLYGSAAALTATGKTKKRSVRSGRVQPEGKVSKASESQTEDEASVVSQKEVDALKAELAEVRGSQLRMEEMLGKLLAGRS